MKIVLHVGCGPTTLAHMPGLFQDGTWQEVRLDIDESVHPDILGTILDMGLVEDGSVDAVYSSHNIEHVLPHEVAVALGEFRRVLRSDGRAVILCPDLQSVAAHVAEGRLMDPLYISAAGPICAVDILYGHRASIQAGKVYMAHRTGFTAATLASHLLEAGFVVAVVGRDKVFGLHCVAYPAEPDPARLDADVAACLPPNEVLLDCLVFR